MKKPIGNAQEQSGYVIQRKSDGKFYSLRHDGIIQWVRKLERAKRFPNLNTAWEVAHDLGRYLPVDRNGVNRWKPYDCTVKDVKSLKSLRVGS